jgi:hypothetical protein
MLLSSFAFLIGEVAPNATDVVGIVMCIPLKNRGVPRFVLCVCRRAESAPRVSIIVHGSANVDLDRVCLSGIVAFFFFF